MSAEQNKDIVRRFVEEVQSQHKLESIDEFVSPEFVNHSPLPPGIAPTREGVRQIHKMLLSAFPDLHFVIHDQVAEGDKVVTRKTLHGTHQGEFMGIPATGKRIEVGVIDVLTLVDGKTTEHWGGEDRLAMMQQLGVVSPQGQGGA